MVTKGKIPHFFVFGIFVSSICFFRFDCRKTTRKVFASVLHLKDDIFKPISNLYYKAKKIATIFRNLRPQMAGVGAFKGSVGHFYVHQQLTMNLSKSLFTEMRQFPSCWLRNETGEPES